MTSSFYWNDFWTGREDEVWDARSPAEKVALAIHWQRLYRDVIKPLSEGREATWHTFNWQKGYGLSETPVIKGPTKVAIFEGAYAARPELEAFLDLKVLLETPNDKRRRDRLIKREGDAYMNNWHKRWDAAEDYYFRKIRPKESFDLIIQNL